MYFISFGVLFCAYCIVILCGGHA